jgi:hypothetical protein
MLSHPFMSRPADVARTPRMPGGCVRNHAMTMSVAQERSLAATSMTDIQSVNKQFRGLEGFRPTGQLLVGDAGR